MDVVSCGGSVKYFMSSKAAGLHIGHVIRMGHQRILQGLVEDGHQLGGSKGGSSKQIRMASECGPMHPLGCRLNQGQGQGPTQGQRALRTIEQWCCNKKRQ